GRSWAKTVGYSSISKAFRRVVEGARVANSRGFYTLRHVFRTIADEVKDQPAIDYVMGHARDDMASVYRERISDERLAAVAEHVRQWLYAPEIEGGGSRQGADVLPLTRTA